MPQTFTYRDVPMTNGAYFTVPVDLSAVSDQGNPVNKMSFSVERVGNGTIETASTWTFQVGNGTLYSTVSSSPSSHAGEGTTQDVDLPPIGRVRAALTTPHTATTDVRATVYMTLYHQPF